MGATELSWQDWGENARLWVAGVKPHHQTRAFIKHLLGTQLYTVCRGGFHRPQKITAVLRLKVNRNEEECGVRAGARYSCWHLRSLRGRGWHRLCQELGWALKGGKNWWTKRGCPRVVKSGQEGHQD